MRNRLKNGIALSLLPQIVLVKWFGSYPDMVENYYSQGIYPFWSGFFRRLLGWIPFSIGDLLYGLLLVVLCHYIFRNWKVLFKEWKTLMRDIVMVLAVFYFSFHISWGLNYYREPVSRALALDENYTTEELLSFTDQLIAHTNELQYQITGDSTSSVQIPYSQNEIFEKTLTAYDHLATIYPELGYRNPSVKRSLFSTPLSYMGYGGYLNPFTHESQVNSKIPMVRFPVVCAHEIGHQIGYSAENEVNFIGFLVMASDEDPLLQYTAYSYALSHCLREVKKREPEHYQEIYSSINGGVLENYRELKAFWTSYDNPLEPLFKSMFNTFLKANSQKAGIKSYNLVVSLIVGYHKKHPLQK